MEGKTNPREEDGSELEEEGGRRLEGWEEGRRGGFGIIRGKDSIFQCHTVVNMKHGVEEMTKDTLEIIVTKEVEDSEPEEEESSG